MIKQTLGIGNTDLERLKNYVEMFIVSIVVDSAIRRTDFAQWLTGQAGTNVSRKTRYIFTRNKGWIDLQHVVSASHSPVSAFHLAEAAGFAYEVYQYFSKGPGSAFRREDLISNELGSVGGVFFDLQGLSVGESVAARIQPQQPMKRVDALFFFLEGGRVDEYYFQARAMEFWTAFE